ncbi:hypothetical protein QFC19_004830 [Naganishia cerealis]|uniref:Uncharacterized protein n=1 Tax=Naganishia cerealis TaxID=610337 RepID=A0ACC2VTS1_9TREE|nr:hypothetical protein QFC19_004830 [Naganishia cerealis]
MQSARQIYPVKARSDNWMYLVVDEASKEGAVVDPYDWKKMLDVVKEKGVNLANHPQGSSIKAYAGSYSPGTNTIVKDKSSFELAGGNIKGGCGRFFEGTAEEMHAALSYLSKLPQDTIVYNGHEYTSGSAKFGQSVEPDNKDISRLQELVKNGDGCSAGKSTIADELTWNVFMRLGQPAIQKATGETDPVKVMGKLREMKNAA